MEKYLYNLVEQYQSATGIKHVDENSISFAIEHHEWLKQQQRIGRSYVTFLKGLQRHPLHYYDCVEFGKSQHDTLAPDLGISMITPYNKGFRELKELIVAADFEVKYGQPTLLINKKEFYIKPHSIDIYYTHNPYASFDISNWPLLHYNGENIMLGVFGTIYDKDYRKKINMLKTLKDRMQQDVIDDYLIDGDKYFYVISSDRDIVTKKLIKQK